MVDAKVRKGSNCEYNSLANLLDRCCDRQHLPMDDMGDREFLLRSAWWCSPGSVELTADTIIRKITLLIHLLEGIETQYIQVPLVCILLKLPDFESQWDGS
jgi:hypothetical protein